MADISGYRTLSETEIDLINLIKANGEALGVLCNRLMVMRFADAEGNPRSADPGWLDIGRTHLQQGIMALVRAVAQPRGF